MHGNLVDRKPAALLGLDDGPKVDDRREPELGEQRTIGVGEPVQPVGPEQAAPADLVTVAGAVPAEITEVDAPLEHEGPGRHR